MQALATRPALLRRTERITAATLAEQLAAPAPPVVLDVRTPREGANKHLAGSDNIPLNVWLNGLPKGHRIGTS